MVDASLAGESNGELAADGAAYTLTVTDKASGEVLFEQTRNADYETTRQDICHLCWRAEMSL